MDGLGERVGPDGAKDGTHVDDGYWVGDEGAVDVDGEAVVEGAVEGEALLEMISNSWHFSFRPARFQIPRHEVFG
jgi:hypothetical protein